jgi:hypothetical protein
MEGPLKMSPRFWMITNRRRGVEDLNGDRGPLTCWAADEADGFQPGASQPI